MKETDYFNFQKLEVYKKAKELVTEVYELLRTYPAEERYALCNQMRRVVILPSNISEGMSRYSTKRTDSLSGNSLWLII